MVFKGKKVLVSGSSGFLGSKLIEKLKAAGASVTTLDKRDGVDICNWDAVAAVADSVDVIYHLAALSYVPHSIENPRETYEVNVLGTLNMLELARTLSAEKFVYTSSYVYGSPQYLPVDEKHPLNPTNPYAQSKVVGEQLCGGYVRDSNLNCVILRPFNVYGPGQSEDFLIPSILKQLDSGRVVLRDSRPRRDFLYVDDVIDAYMRAGEYSNSSLEVFNVGYGESHSVEEIVDKIVGCYGSDVEVKYLNEPRENEILDTVADISKLRKVLGWAPKVAIDEGLERMLEVIRT